LILKTGMGEEIWLIRKRLSSSFKREESLGERSKEGNHFLKKKKKKKSSGARHPVKEVKGEGHFRRQA